jgi:hypothetical protein
MSKVTDVDIALSILDHQLVDADGQTAGRSMILRSPASTATHRKWWRSSSAGTRGDLGAT